ncbi:MAG: hypothetical protein CMN17_14345 [Roseovarius sp.]|nr:hypothetical protein [Roseovarius sp.]
MSRGRIHPESGGPDRRAARANGKARSSWWPSGRARPGKRAPLRRLGERIHVAQVEALWQGLPQAGLAVIPGTAHAAHLEKPGLFHAILDDASALAAVILGRSR